MKITIIGTGRLSYSLIPNLQRAGFEVLQLIARSEEVLAKYGREYSITSLTTDLNDLHKETEVVILCVSDTAISELGIYFKGKGCVVLHTSGSLAIDALEGVGDDIGVLYPLQIFTTDKIVPLWNVPFFYEGRGKAEKGVEELVNKLSGNGYKVDSEVRLRVHLGAVIACNFSNYLFNAAAGILPNGMPFSIYESLMREHIDKVFTFLPQNTQTGPAIRGDKVTIAKHLALLEDKPELRDLYEKISELINPSLKFER